MKKLLFFAMSLILMAGCSGNGASEKANEDSIRIADSIAKVEAAQAAAEQARLDSIRQDSINSIEIEKQYSNALTLNLDKRKKKETYQGDNQCAGIYWPLIVKNNTDITLTPADYTITYVGHDEIQDNEGYLVHYNKKESLKVPELQPQSSETVILSVPVGKYFSISDPKVKLLISKEEFAKRFREETVFDKDQNKFISK